MGNKYHPLFWDFDRNQKRALERRASGEGGNEYHPLMGAQIEIKSAPWKGALVAKAETNTIPLWGSDRNEKRALKRRASGDGGNRTRVRKTRPSKIYERSRLMLSPQVTQPAKLTCGQPLGSEDPLSRIKRRHARHSTIVTPSPITGWSTGRVDAASSRRPAANASSRGCKRSVLAQPGIVLWLVCSALDWNSFRLMI